MNHNERNKLVISQRCTVKIVRLKEGHKESERQRVIGKGREIKRNQKKKERQREIDLKKRRNKEVEIGRKIREKKKKT